ncbi:hypothetical protein F5972_08305 [Microbispora cellulosiformans]|uniref:Uncharacterized protein n=1 Tax=Microbispora cellulosiformans TaxID=2614688 RepID=A0A5J5K4X4_9ACTN|nr:hypothetical protein [Microbispora cellulosiformans]KAA9379645.1 hypothetical protein F5972_08305 [Microbispora cellulosiformans]
MITLDEAKQVLPVGRRVRHLYLDWAGEVAPRPEGRPGAGRVHDSDVSGNCCSVNIAWDHGEHLWTSPRELVWERDGDPPPDPLLAFAQAVSAIGRSMEVTHRTMQASGAMGLAFRGDLDRLRDRLRELPPEQVRGIHDAARVLCEVTAEAPGDAAGPGGQRGVAGP